ncbi:efflux RND transporter periplasmic adaptor subunit [Brucepastera parasyntrophica]|uniref:efflux RND transporter periplasmic adaptor subunit n=1 Tax=Brucepastera parasyntrophica TaxID=2880008 RepID=UPI002108EFAB|nr:efflux RND transporter periplasmic adaptor subunit [Brucepastera parasyntrophica]ULQ59273.1 efflux RND transporter periplasmic adaptor subunit [Brucepastera parasyntrophica]
MKFFKTHKKLVIIGLIVIIAVVLFFLIFNHYKSKNKITYITETVKRQSIQKIVNASGEVRAIDLVTVGAQASGKIEKLYVAVGQEVQEGDLIAEIDSTTQQNEVDSNKSKVTSYQIQLDASKTSLAIAERQYKRLQALRKENAASTEELENAQSAYETARSNVSQIQSALEEANISLSTAETNLGYTKITAPFSGMIVSIPVKQGQTVNAAMSTPTIVQIADLSNMEILIEISEGDISNIQPDLKVTYSILADLGTVHETTLKSIDPGLTLLSNGEYTGVVGSSEAIYYYGRLNVPNEDGKLRIGMTTQNVIYVSHADNALTVSSIAIKENGNNKYVEVLTKNGVEQRNIETGISDGLNVEVRSGLNEGDTVVTAQMSASEIASSASSSGGRRGF